MLGLNMENHSLTPLSVLADSGARAIAKCANAAILAHFLGVKSNSLYGNLRRMGYVIVHINNYVTELPKTIRNPKRW
jgi:hypothetical protein